MGMACVGNHEDIPERNEEPVWIDDAVEDGEDNQYWLHITRVPDT